MADNNTTATPADALTTFGATSSAAITRMKEQLALRQSAYGDTDKKQDYIKNHAGLEKWLEREGGEYAEKYGRLQTELTKPHPDAEKVRDLVHDLVDKGMDVGQRLKEAQALCAVTEGQPGYGITYTSGLLKDGNLFRDLQFRKGNETVDSEWFNGIVKQVLEEDFRKRHQKSEREQRSSVYAMTSMEKRGDQWVERKSDAEKDFEQGVRRGAKAFGQDMIWHGLNGTAIPGAVVTSTFTAVPAATIVTDTTVASTATAAVTFKDEKEAVIAIKKALKANGYGDTLDETDTVDVATRTAYQKYKEDLKTNAGLSYDASLIIIGAEDYLQTNGKTTLDKLSEPLRTAPAAAETKTETVVQPTLTDQEIQIKKIQETLGKTVRLGSTDTTNTYYKGAADGKINDGLKSGLADFLKDIQTSAREYKDAKNGIYGDDTHSAILAHKDDQNPLFKAANEMLPSLGYLNTTKDTSGNSLYRQLLTVEQLNAPGLKPAVSKPPADISKTPIADLKKAAEEKAQNPETKDKPLTMAEAIHRRGKALDPNYDEKKATEVLIPALKEKTTIDLDAPIDPNDPAQVAAVEAIAALYKNSDKTPEGLRKSFDNSKVEGTPEAKILEQVEQRVDEEFKNTPPPPQPKKKVGEVMNALTSQLGVDQAKIASEFLPFLERYYGVKADDDFDPDNKSQQAKIGEAGGVYKASDKTSEGLYLTFVRAQIQKAEQSNGGKPLTTEQFIDAAAGGIDPANKQKVKDTLLSYIDGNPAFGLKRSDLIDSDEKKALMGRLLTAYGNSDKTPEGLKKTLEGQKDEPKNYMWLLTDPRAIGTTATGLGVYGAYRGYKWWKGRGGADVDPVPNRITDPNRLITGEVREPAKDPRTRAQKLEEGIRLNEEKLAKLKANGGSASDIEALENELRSQKNLQHKGKQKLLTAGDSETPAGGKKPDPAPVKPAEPVKAGPLADSSKHPVQVGDKVRLGDTSHEHTVEQIIDESKTGGKGRGIKIRAVNGTEVTVYEADIKAGKTKIASVEGASRPAVGAPEPAAPKTSDPVASEALKKAQAEVQAAEQAAERAAKQRASLEQNRAKLAADRAANPDGSGYNQREKKLVQAEKEIGLAEKASAAQLEQAKKGLESIGGGKAPASKPVIPAGEKPILSTPEPSMWERFQNWRKGGAAVADDAVQAEGALAKTGKLAALVERYPGLKKVPVVGKWLVAGTIVLNIGTEVMDAKPTTTTQAKTMAVGRGVQAGAEALYPPVQVAVGVIKQDDRRVATGLGAIGGAKMGAIIGGTAGSVVPVIGTAGGAVAGGIVGMFAGAAGGEWIVGVTPEEKKALIERYGNYNNVKTEGRTIAAQYGLPVDGIKTKDGKVMGIEEIMRDPTKLDELSKRSNFQDPNSREGFVKLAELGSNYNKTYQILQQDIQTVKDTGHSRQEWEEKGLIGIQMDSMKGKPGGGGTIA